MSGHFAAGDSVRVKTRYPPGHVRTPYYCRGKTGVVERVCGAYRNPEKLAYGDHEAEKIALYRVRFEQRELWESFEGEGTDAVEIEIFEHWLESAGN